MTWIFRIVCRVFGHRPTWVTTGVNSWWADRGIRYGFKGYTECSRCREQLSTRDYPLNRRA